MACSNYTETVHYRCLNEYFPRQTDDLYLTLCGIEQCAPNKKREERIREGYHLHVVVSGKGIVDTGTEQKMVKAGQIFMLKPGKKIAYWPLGEDPWTYCWMSFDGAHAPLYAENLGFTEGVYVQDCYIETEQFFMICDRLLNTPRLDTASALKRLGLLFQYIGLGIESFTRNQDWHSRKEHQPLYHKAEYVQHAVDFIENNYIQASVESVADYLGLNRSYFSSIFKQSQGMTPSEFILRVRMKESCHMLQNQTMSIQSIAGYVGYEDSLTFSKVFKRFFGVSPKHYREMPVDERPTLDEIIAARKEKGIQE
ncbi:MAG: AraC family transcriptional regulator [Clostridia bacterium]|nr:AraC family transcriptional regulator [Clostridia bacterium]